MYELAFGERDVHPLASLCAPMMHTLHQLHCNFATSGLSQFEEHKSSTAQDSNTCIRKTRSTSSVDASEAADTTHHRAESVSLDYAFLPSNSEPRSFYSQHAPEEHRASCARLGSSLPLDIPLRREQPPKTPTLEQPQSGLMPLTWMPCVEFSEEEMACVDELMLTLSKNAVLGDFDDIDRGVCHSEPATFVQDIEYCSGELSMDHSGSSLSKWTRADLAFEFDFDETSETYPSPPTVPTTLHIDSIRELRRLRAS